MFEIYICTYCGGPIYFPHGQKMHVGTGWYCWKGEAGPKEPAFFGKFTFNTPKRQRKQLLDQAIDLFKKWLSNQAKKAIVEFLASQLRERKSDVVHDFMQFLVNEHPAQNEKLLAELRTTRPWKTFARGRKGIKSKAKRVPTRSHVRKHAKGQQIQ